MRNNSHTSRFENRKRPAAVGRFYFGTSHTRNSDLPVSMVGELPEAETFRAHEESTDS